MKSALRLSLLSAFLLLTLVPPVAAQYMRITTDNPADNTRLRSTGTTILTITLNTNHDRDNTLQSCNSHSAGAGCGTATTANPLTLFSYQVYLHAEGGAVSWGNFAPGDAAFTPLQPQVNNSTDVEFTYARPPGTSSPAGLNTIGTISVTLVSGTPRIDIARFPNNPLDASAYGTSFGTNCDGGVIGNTYILGNAADPCGATSGLPPDWYDADGAAAPAVTGPPVLNPISNMSLNIGGCGPATADQAISATDPDAEAITFTFTGPPWMTVTSNVQVGNTRTGNIHLSTPPSAGTFPASVTATAGGQSDTKPFTITVGQINQGPVLQQPANMSVTEGSTLNQTLLGTDPCGAALTFVKVSGPTYMTVTTTNATTGNVRLAPGFSDAGTATASVAVSNGTVSDTKSFSISVCNLNRGPILAQPANMTVSEAATANQTLSAADADGNPLTFTKSAGPTFMTVTTTSPGTGLASGNVALAPGFSDSGSYVGTISVTDGGGGGGCGTGATDTKSFTIAVNNFDRAPNLNPIPDQQVCEGSTANQAIIATDADADPLLFSIVAAPTYMTVTTITSGSGTATGNIHIAPGFSDAGTASATVRASDGVLTSDRSFMITVTNGCHPPVLNPIADMTLDEGTTANQNLTATDADGDALIFSKGSGPLFMTVTTTTPGTGTATGTVYLTPGFSDFGIYAASVRVTDGSLTDAKSFTITVNDGHHCPIANPGGSYSAIVGVPVSFDGTGSSDPDGDALSYAWDFGDGSLGAGPSPMHVYVTAGVFTVTLTVTDNDNPPCSNSATTTATILQACPATVFNGYDTIRLGSGKPTWFAYVQPTTGCYANTDVVIASFVMKYAGREISASGKTSTGVDKNGDGIQEIKVSFSKDDLRTLFTGTGLPNGHNLVTVTLEASLVTGGIIQGTTQLDVVNNGNFSAPTVAPNPLNPSATLTYTTSRAGYVRIDLFDIQGRLVRTLVDEPAMAAGSHEAIIDGRGKRGEKLPSGVYYIRGKSNEGEFKQVITILK